MTRHLMTSQELKSISAISMSQTPLNTRYVVMYFIRSVKAVHYRSYGIEGGAVLLWFNRPNTENQKEPGRKKKRRKRASPLILIM